MATVKSFEDLEVWKKARVLSQIIFEITNELPFSKDFSLRNQINDASGSIMDNIAEGFDRGGNKEFIQFLAYARGSCGEVRSQLYRAEDRKYIDNERSKELRLSTEEISKMITGLMKYLQQSNFKGPKYIQEPDINYSTEQDNSKPETLNSKL